MNKLVLGIAVGALSATFGWLYREYGADNQESDIPNQLLAITVRSNDAMFDGPPPHARWENVENPAGSASTLEHALSIAEKCELKRFNVEGQEGHDNHVIFDGRTLRWSQFHCLLDERYPPYVEIYTVPELCPDPKKDRVYGLTLAIGVPHVTCFERLDETYAKLGSKPGKLD